MALQFLDLLGVFVFAVAGALIAVRKDMDLFGIFVLAFLPAVGGGTLRDLMLDVPVFWIDDVRYIGVVAVAVGCVFFGYRFLNDGARLLKWMDALGLAVFSALGAQKALVSEVSATVAVMMGVITAVAGGMIRDVVANEIPLVLRQEIYATAALLGALVLVATQGVVGEWSVWLAIAAAFGVRAAGIVWGWSLPKMRHSGG